MPVSTIDTFVQSEILFPRNFADVEERDWGILFVTPTIPDSYDGNHACVLNRCGEPARVVEEIVAFYRSRGLGPRVNYLSASGDSPDLRKVLLDAGFTLGDEEVMCVYVFRGPSRITPNPEVHVRQADTVDADLLRALTSIGDLRIARVLERRVRRRGARLFVGEIAGEAASVALLERAEGIYRVDEVNTAEQHRRKGCARAVMGALVAYYQRHYSAPLYLWTDNPVAERIYTEAGFVKIEHSITRWVAWLEGPQGSAAEKARKNGQPSSRDDP